jgi:hypothetical protein
LRSLALDVPNPDDKIIRLHLTADPTQDLFLERALVEQLWTGLILGWGEWLNATILVLKPTNEGTFERLGLSCPFFARYELKRDDKEAFIGTRKFTWQRLILE